ncbi:MAG: replication initiation protein [Candidatus Thiodiazotropha sp. (ex Cardiolucina cf. quadrata)]|nr:replication initiation protein [Candidatus Thiodiazotropha sp. (ex Cardiolucina cf. quadrata)]
MKRIDEWAEEACEALCQDSKRGTPKVYKSNMLIEAYYKLTLVEQKVIDLVIARLSPYEEVPEVITLTAVVYSETYETTLKRAYQVLKDASEHLHERMLEINGQVIPWLKEPARYLDGEIEIRFSEAIKPHLSHFTCRFTQYELQRVAPLQSTHSIRLYELCRQWGGSTGRGKRYIPVDKFKKCLGLEGRYKEFFSLKADVIEPAIEELEAKSGLVFREWKVIRKHRKAVSLSFKYKEKRLPGSNLVRFPSEKRPESGAAEQSAEARSNKS